MVGALDNWVKLQDEYESFFFVADWHALTTDTYSKNIKKDSIEMAKDWLAAGIDPDKSTMFVQSQVSEHAELHLAFSMLNNLPRLERMPSFKAQMQHLLKKEGDAELTRDEITKARSSLSYGFMGYPVLQAADILIYKADKIPVGDDQVPHLELTREIARTFNKTYGNLFPEPEALTTITPRILGTDGRKMSKSYHNTILPTFSADEVRTGVKKMVTDTNRVRRDDPGDPRECSVYDLHLAYSSDDDQITVGKECRAGTRGCGDCKLQAANALSEKYGGYKERRQSWEGKDREIVEILTEGSRKAKSVASETMAEVKDYMMLSY
jgi:tryptophanyl-tRNA synthetase